jgi:glutamyl-tRNA synthetase
MATTYRGRLAPSPTGYLHIGHAVTFWHAQERCRAAGGEMVLRIEDLDPERCRPEFCRAIEEDLRWCGLGWDEGPFVQSARRDLYFGTWQKLRECGVIYACDCSRRDVLAAAGAPHGESDEPLYNGKCRDRGLAEGRDQPAGVNWRFRVPDGERMCFVDGRLGEQHATAGADFGDFVVWRRDDVPSYQLAVVADDAAMRITEVVRGEDLLVSTFRQLLLGRALGLRTPAFFHTALLMDETGRRLAKRDAALSLQALRSSGFTPQQLRAAYISGEQHPNS